MPGKSSNVEYDHVLVEVVEVAGVALVPVIGELRRLVPVRIHAGIIAVDAERIVIEDGAQDAGRVNRVPLAGGQLDCTCVAEGEALTRPLPEGNSLRIDELGVLVMEGVGLEEYIRGRTELGQHDHMLEVFRGEPLHAAHVEQSGHASKTVDGERHVVRRVADEVRVKDCISGGQALGVLLIEAIQQVDSSGVAGSAVGSAAVHVVERLAHHVVDSSHDEVVKGDRHALLNLIEKHGQEGIELSSRGEGLIQGLLLNGALDLERRHLVEELDVYVGLVEHVGIVGGPVSEIPALILGGLREPGANLLQNGAVTPIVHEDGGGAAGVGTVNEDHLTDVVDEGANELVERIGVEDGIACIDDALQVFSDQVILTESLDKRVIDDLINLFYFHCYSPFSLVV